MWRIRTESLNKRWPKKVAFFNSVFQNINEEILIWQQLSVMVPEELSHWTEFCGVHRSRAAGRLLTRWFLGRGFHPRDTPAERFCWLKSWPRRENPHLLLGWSAALVKKNKDHLEPIRNNLIDIEIIIHATLLLHSHRTLTSYWMESSPASLTATHVYLPESSAWALGICNTRPPWQKKKKNKCSISAHLPQFSSWVLFVSPGRMRTLSLEVISWPSLNQVSVGGGTALVSQYSDIGLLMITSRRSAPTPGKVAASASSPGLLKIGGTETRARAKKKQKNNSISACSVKTELR